MYKGTGIEKNIFENVLSNLINCHLSILTFT